MFVSKCFWEKQLLKFGWIRWVFGFKILGLGIRVWPIYIRKKTAWEVFQAFEEDAAHQTTIFQLAIDLYDFILPKTLSARHSYVISMVLGYYINRWDSFPYCTKLQDIDRWWPKPNATYFLVPPPQLAVTTNCFFFVPDPDMQTFQVLLFLRWGVHTKAYFPRRWRSCNHYAFYNGFALCTFFFCAWANPCQIPLHWLVYRDLYKGLLSWLL